MWYWFTDDKRFSGLVCSQQVLRHVLKKNINTWSSLSLSVAIAGILLMMALCEQVHVYEYIPSMRQTDLCHYHERYYDAACTLGAYHPLLYEKSLIQRINTGPESDLRRKGRVTLPGFSTVDCDIWDMKPDSLSPDIQIYSGLFWLTKGEVQ